MKMLTEKRYILRSELQLKNCLRYLTEEVTLPDDKQKKPYAVIIKPHVESKTEDQREGFHWLCKMLGDELGYSLLEIKEMCKRECMGTKTVKVGSCVQEITGSSESLNIIQYGELIDTVYRLGAEAGVVLPILDKYRNQAA